MQQDKALSRNLEDDEDDRASDLRAELKRLKHQLHQTKQEGDEAREQVDRLSAQSHRPEKQRRDPEQRDDRAELKKAVAERDAARQDAQNARAELQRKEVQFAEKARHVVEQLEQRRSSQNTMTVAAHRYEGPYHPSKDRLLLSMLDELMANADLARQQYIHSKQQTARLPHAHLTPAQQSYALAMAARWWLVASPPSSYTRKVSWAQDGYTLDADAELYLYAHSRDRSAEATWQAFWLEPVQPRRRRKRR